MSLLAIMLSITKKCIHRGIGLFVVGYKRRLNNPQRTTDSEQQTKENYELVCSIY
jgi:hypothetical protein